MLSHWGGKPKDLAELQSFMNLLAESDELTVSELCVKFSDRAKIVYAPRETSRSPAKKTSVLKIDAYALRLRDTTLDRMQSLAVISEMEADRTMKVSDVNEVAGQMTGAGIQYKKKIDAITALRIWINRKFETQRRVEGSSGIF